MKYKKGSFIVIPNQSTLKGLDPKAQCLFMWLCFHANQEGECFPSRSLLSKESGMSIASVKRTIKILEDIGLIEAQRRKEGTKNLTNLYAIVIDGGGFTQTPPRFTQTPGVGSHRPTELNPILTQSNKDDFPFETFWNLYDKKIGKPKCEGRWKRLLEEEKKKIMEYIPRYKIAQPNKIYRKNPFTFLNNEGWEDELIVEGEKKSVQLETRPIAKVNLPERKELSPEAKKRVDEQKAQIAKKFRIKQ